MRAGSSRWNVSLARASLACVFSLTAACDWLAEDDPQVAASSTGDGGTPGAPPSDSPDGGPVPVDGAADIGPAKPVSCATTFRYVPPPGKGVRSVVVTGEWNLWKKEGVPMVGPDADGAFTADVELPAGLHAYKLIIDDQWELDAAARFRKWVGGVENSAVEARDCRLPVLTLAQKTIARDAPGKGRFQAVVQLQPGHGKPGLDSKSVKVTLRDEDAQRDVGASVDPANGSIAVDVTGLNDGKYTLVVEAKDSEATAAGPLRLVFWIEERTFEWRDAVIYMVMVDRFRDGDPSNNPARKQGVDPRADFHGGDLNGIRDKIADGTFDRLGVKALWLSPFHTNPEGSYLAADGHHQVMGYHGYWPVKAREVDPRIGGAAALTSLVKEAHKHGIRILQDFVVNHVHQDHEYFKAHPEWFRTGCVCGTQNCDWTGKRLECLFTDYMPDVNYTVPEVAEQYASDALYWIDTFNLDGLRVDAVKHVEDVAVFNLTARIRDAFEATGTRVFLTGETAMGWGGDNVNNSLGEYGTISRYLGPNGLDGQADFVLYHAVPYRTFSSDDKGLAHADYWAQQSILRYPAGSVMTPYIGSHDTTRFVTLAGHSSGDPSAQWDNVAGPPSGPDAYERHRLALAWLMTLPGAPLVYYGDEYAEWGGADPNNRKDWRADGNLGDEERATLALTQSLGRARHELVALRRGAYESLKATHESLVFARRTAAGEAAIVALSKSPQATTVTAPVAALGFADGTVLHDRLGGPNVRVTGGSISVSLGRRGAAILAP